MLSLYQYLLKVKGYSEADAEQTCFRWENCMEIPFQWYCDARSYYEEYLYDDHYFDDEHRINEFEWNSINEGGADD